MSTKVRKSKTRVKKPYRRANVEITDVCNLRCSFCPEAERKNALEAERMSEVKAADPELPVLKAGRQFMSPATFEKILIQLSPLIDELCPHLLGEPLAHPEFGTLLDLCSKYSVPVNLTTNGSLLDPKRENLLLHPALRQVNFSVQSIESNFKEGALISKLERLFSVASRIESERPECFVNYRFWDWRSGPQSDVPSLARQLVARYYGVDLSELKRDPIRKSKGGGGPASRGAAGRSSRGASLRLRGRVYVHSDRRFTWPDLKLPIRGTQGRCLALSNHFGVLSDGTVVACCLDQGGKLGLGNVHETPIAEILEGLRARRIRGGFSRGVLVEDLCQRCDYIERFDGTP